MTGEPAKIRTLLVDDEPLARRTLSLLLKDDPEITIIGECSNGFEAVKAIRRDRPDLLFLDIQMPEMNGFEVLEAAGPDLSSVIVFVTAYDQFAVKAFEAQALDYVLKPFDDERFEQAVKRAKSHIYQNRSADINRRLLEWLASQQMTSPPATEKALYLQRLSVKSGGRVHFLKVAEIEWIEASDQYVVLHVAGKQHLLRDSLNRLETQLDPDQFFRVHRSALVNLDFVRELELNENGDGTIVLSNRTSIKLSRSRREKFETALVRRS
ncbi:MAG: response regulator transcription factor [Acidobacteria bacterium]|nr:response regulator transcription factor [Acidobacteriota bacterium]